MNADDARERDRAAALAKIRHDVGNALTIAQASLEAMLDGVVPITDSRLNRLRQLLKDITAAVYELTEDRGGG